jgi:dTDP-4-dehydrorhamnose reductase
MKLLLLGCNGQLGKELKNDLPKITQTISFNKDELDINNFELLDQVVNTQKPKIIINAAAYTNVEQAENNQKKAFEINCDAIDHLSKIAAEKDIWFIHYSTDYVFDGKKNSRYMENDHTNPINIYGKSKLAGEIKIINSNCKYIIFRTTWVCGEFGNNFIRTIIGLSKRKNSISVVNDQIGVPTCTTLISKVTRNLVNDICNENFWKSGIYNLVPNGSTNWYLIAKLITDIAIKEFKDKNFKELDIKKIITSEYNNSVSRPLNSLLSNEKLQKQLKFTLPDWEIDFIPLARRILKGN